MRIAILVAALICLGSGQPTLAESSFVTVENKSGQTAKIALPGGKANRINPGVRDLRVDIEVTDANGVEAKAWWVSNPRELCVIFVRYEGHVVIAGKKNIRCLGH